MINIEMLMSLVNGWSNAMTAAHSGENENTSLSQTEVEKVFSDKSEIFVGPEGIESLPDPGPSVNRN